MQRYGFLWKEIVKIRTFIGGWKMWDGGWLIDDSSLLDCFMVELFMAYSQMVHG